MAKIEEVKIITLGNSSVGKTSFIIKYIDNKFIEFHLTTLGVDFKQKKIKLKNGKDVHLRIFDTAGQERFKSVSASFIKKVDGVILVYDISNLGSFESINNWIKNIKDIGKEKLPVILVGNKCDLPPDKRKVSLEDGEKKANEFNIPFYETSCLNGINIKEVFETLIENIINGGRRYTIGDFKIAKESKKKQNCC